MSLSFSLAALILLPLAFAHPHHKPGNFSWANTKYLIAFGDSYTYVQGTNGLQNYSFIGDYLDFDYSPQKLLSDRIVQNQVRLFLSLTAFVGYFLQDYGKRMKG